MASYYASVEPSLLSNSYREVEMDRRCYYLVADACKADI